MAELIADPPTALFPASGGASNHQLMNGTDQRLAVKVKCSDNALYRVNPVYSFIDPGASLVLEITRTAGPAKDDRLLVQYVAVPPELGAPQDAFAAGGAFPELTIPMSAQ